jgi:uncharacterized protein YacL
MNRIRREVVNGLLVLIISTLLSAAIAAFQIKFDILVLVLIVMAVAIAITGYVVLNSRSDILPQVKRANSRTQSRCAKEKMNGSNGAALLRDCCGTERGTFRDSQVRTMRSRP